MRSLILHIVACLMLGMSAAWAQDLPEGASAPVWLVRPNAELFAAFYPLAAITQNVEGRVDLDCVVRLDQRADCVARSESPAGWGFAEAAINMSRSFRLAPAHVNGAPVEGGRVRMPIRFNLMQDEEEPRAVELDLPGWAEAPNADAVRAAWPQGAAQSDLRGRAVLSCRVREDRFLSCELMSETPTGVGLGEAALSLAPAFRVSQGNPRFIERYRNAPFTLPLNFGFPAEMEPVSRITAGATPVQLPPPPPQYVERIYPRGAYNQGINGSATITCTANAALSLECAVSREEPAGWGFGDAALSFVRPYFDAMASWTPSPFLVGDRVEMTIPFEKAR